MAWHQSDDRDRMLVPPPPESSASGSSAPGSSASSPSALAIVALYAALVFAIGGAASAPSHAALMALGVEMSPVHEWTADFLKLLALVGIWPLLVCSRLGLRDGLGLPPRGRWRHGAIAALVGLASLGVWVALLVSLDVRVLRPELDAGLLMSAAVKALITALLVATIEELWFRGALQSVLQRAGALLAIWVVALIYTALHFLRPDQLVEPPHTWLDGYAAIAGMFGRFTDGSYWDSALALLAAGLLFGWLRQSTGHILAAWGLHAGWVFAIQFSRRITQANAGSELSFLVGRYDGIIGMGFLVVAFACILALKRLASEQTEVPG